MQASPVLHRRIANGVVGGGPSSDGRAVIPPPPGLQDVAGEIRMSPELGPKYLAALDIVAGTRCWSGGGEGLESTLEVLRDHGYVVRSPSLRWTLTGLGRSQVAARHRTVGIVRAACWIFLLAIASASQFLPVSGSL